MAATVGHMTVNLLARVGKGEPIVVGTIDVPFTAAPDALNDGRLVLTPEWRDGLARGLRRAARAVRRPQA